MISKLKKETDIFNGDHLQNFMNIVLNILQVSLTEQNISTEFTSFLIKQSKSIKDTGYPNLTFDADLISDYCNKKPQLNLYLDISARTRTHLNLVFKPFKELVASFFNSRDAVYETRVGSLVVGACDFKFGVFGSDILTVFCLEHKLQLQIGQRQAFITNISSTILDYKVKSECIILLVLRDGNLFISKYSIDSILKHSGNELIFDEELDIGTFETISLETTFNDRYLCVLADDKVVVLDSQSS